MPLYIIEGYWDSQVLHKIYLNNHMTSLTSEASVKDNWIEAFNNLIGVFVFKLEFERLHVCYL